MRHQKIISFILLLFFIIACSVSPAPPPPLPPIRLEGESFFVRGNMLYSKLDSCNDEQFNKEFMDLEGVQISKAYRIVKEELNVHLNEDTLLDKLLVISPNIQEIDSFRHKCYKTSYNTRLLLVLLRDSMTKQLNISMVNEKAILNRIESQSQPFRRLESEGKRTFMLRYYLGSSLRCYYDFFFQQKDTDYYLYKSYSYCYFIDFSQEEEKTRWYNDVDSTKLSHLDIRKFIIFPDFKRE